MQTKGRLEKIFIWKIIEAKPGKEQEINIFIYLESTRVKKMNPVLKYQNQQMLSWTLMLKCPALTVRITHEFWSLLLISPFKTTVQGVIFIITDPLKYW